MVGRLKKFVRSVKVGRGTLLSVWENRERESYTYPLKKSFGSKSAAVMQTNPFKREKNIGAPLCTAAVIILSPCIGNSIFSFSSFKPKPKKGNTENF